jgi:hypothetical protein
MSMRSIQELVIMRRKLESEYNRLEADSNTALINNYEQRLKSLKRMVSILDDAIAYYPLFEFLGGEKVEDNSILNHIPRDAS